MHFWYILWKEKLSEQQIMSQTIWNSSAEWGEASFGKVTFSVRYELLRLGVGKIKTLNQERFWVREKQEMRLEGCVVEGLPGL